MRWLSILTLLTCLLPPIALGSQPVAHAWPTVVRGTLDTNNVDVTMIQYLLCSHGYLVTVDGRFGSKTQWQVRRFQRSQQLQTTGVVDGLTWRRLIVILRQGSRGDAVKAAQAALQQHVESLSIDGHFGRQTDQAVRSFEQNNGLPTDGVIGSATWLRLTDPVPD